MLNNDSSIILDTIDLYIQVNYCTETEPPIELTRQQEQNIY